MHNVSQLPFWLSAFLLNPVPLFSQFTSFSHSVALPWPLSFTHQSTLNTELQKKVKKTNSTRKPFPTNSPSRCVCSCLCQCPRASGLSWPWPWQPGGFHRSAPAPQSCLLLQCWSPTPRWHKPTTTQGKISKSSLETSNCQLPKRLSAISSLIVSVGDTEGKQERDTSDSRSPKRGTTCSVDRISSCLASVQWLYLLSGFSAPMVSWHHVFPLVFKAQAVNKQNCHNFGFLLTLSDLKGRRFVDMCNEDYWNVPWPWNEKQSKQGNIFWNGTFFFPSLSLVPPKFKCDYTDLIPSWRWLRDLDLRSSEQNYPLTSALENSGSWVWPTILFRYYILLEHWYNYCHIFPGWCLIWEEFLHLSAVTSSLEEGASCRCFLLGSFFLTIFSWAMLLMSHKSACKGCCGLCILQLAVKHTMNPFHSVTVSVSLEGRKGWVHLLRAEYSPTCYRPETAEINQCSFPFLGSSVKKTNTEKKRQVFSSWAEKYCRGKDHNLTPISE